MLQKSYILKFITGFFLVLFACSITPKKIWHDLLANHQDVVSKKNLLSEKGNQIHKKVINCNCDQLIVESVYVNKTCIYSIEIPLVEKAFVLKPYSFSFHLRFEDYGLRGPPMGGSLKKLSVA